MAVLANAYWKLVAVGAALSKRLEKRAAK